MGQASRSQQNLEGGPVVEPVAGRWGGANFQHVWSQTTMDLTLKGTRDTYFHFDTLEKNRLQTVF